jgi:hypothetical protein
MHTDRSRWWLLSALPRPRRVGDALRLTPWSARCAADIAEKRGARSMTVHAGGG